MPGTKTPVVPYLIAAAMLVLPSAVLAQAETGTGGGPASTITAPNTTTVGQTKPPSGGGGTVREDRTERTPQQKQDSKIQEGICIGCGVK